MSTISASTTTTTAYKVTADTTGTLVLQTGATPTTAVTIDTSQNVGVGATPAAWQAGAAIQMQDNVAYSRYGYLRNAYFDGSAYKYNTTGAASLYLQATGAHQWFYAASGSAGASVSFAESMRIDSSGNLLVGDTSGNFRILGKRASAGTVLGLWNTAENGAQIVFHNTGGSSVGSVTVTSSVTAYNTTSDYRLKENIAPMVGALNTVSRLKPVTYTWKSTGESSQGFIAHELQEVCPDCVTGEKDAVDDEGNPVYQGIDVSFLVGTLTAAIQELKAELDAAKADIATLKGAA